jgi:SMI1/KNR4 family protein
METLLEKANQHNKELISKVCESILSKIKVAECCILYDANNDINTSFINNISEQIEKQGDRTGLEMWHNEICLSAFEGFSLSCILPFIEQFKQRLNAVYPRPYCLIVYITNTQDIYFRFHVYRKDEGMWINSDIEADANPLLYDLEERLNIDSIIQRIQDFKEEYVECFDPISDDALQLAQENIPFQLPADYIRLLQFSNGILICGDEVLGINHKPFDLIKAYKTEHEATQVHMPSHIVPFAPDGRGNYYCFDAQQGSQIVFWVANHQYSEEDKPEVVNSDFCDWFNEVMIDWCIELEGQDIFK